MKKINVLFRTLKLSFASVILMAVAGCSDNLISSPVGSSDGSLSASLSMDISYPGELVASHGEKRNISLYWTPVIGAKQYNIFSADTPFSEFLQIGEASSNSFSYTIPAGKNKYFKIQSINEAGARSTFSNVVIGSTLAEPVITAVEMNDSGTSAVVKWWMSNCTPETYQNRVHYTVYAEASGQIIELYAEKAENSVTFKDLLPKTKYKFRVEAYLDSEQTKSEISDEVDAETARKLIPGAPEEFTATQGCSVSEIVLSWKLPEFVDVSLGNNQYESHKVYFRIYRKESEDEASMYVPIKDYSDDDYAPGKTVSFTDTDVSRDKSYDYKIQSFVADTPKVISSDSSVAEAKGWLVSHAVLHSDGAYFKSEDEKSYTKISFNFSSVFKSYGIPYKYVLVQTKSLLENENSLEKSVVEVFDSILALNSFIIEYEGDKLKDEEGYYKYELYVLPADAEISAETEISQITDLAFGEASVAPGNLIVTDDANRVPEVEHFSIEDGYSSKFIIKWSYNSGYIYKLNWTPVVDGVNKEEESITLEPSNNPGEGELAVYEHTASSGDRRIYTLTASNGISQDFKPEESSREEQNDKIYETLGTPDVKAGQPEYDSITVSWNSVQMAKTYNVEAYYSDDETKALLSEGALSEEEGRCTYKIQKPEGYDDAYRAGKSITLKVTAESETGDSTEKAVNSAVLGPASLNTTVSLPTSDSVSVTWNKIYGATGYIVYRVRYSDGKASKIEAADLIYVDGNEKTITNSGESVNENGYTRADISSTGSTITFKDICQKVTAEESAQAGYQLNQSRLSWGIPYGYFVLPVKNPAGSSGEDHFEFSFDENTSDIHAKCVPCEFDYSGIKTVKGATSGYGLNLKASKATDSEIITLSWNHPYNGSSKTPSVYFRESGSKVNSWSLYAANSYATNLISDDTGATVGVIPGDSLKAYEFAVCYEKLNKTVSFVDSFVDEHLTMVDEVSPEEQKNKGYVLSLDFVSASYVSGYTEQVDWLPYDYDNRAVGPDYYEIQVLNTNDRNGWTRVAKITPDLSAGDYGNNAVVSEADADAAKISVVKSGEKTLQIEPVFDKTDKTSSDDTGGYTSGVLKVVRDAKHYYRLAAFRSINVLNEDGGTVEKIVMATTGDNPEKPAYAYRNLTDEELAKSAMLAFTYAFYINDGGNADLSNVDKQFKYGGAHTINGTSGNAVFYARARATSELGLGKYKQYYEFNEYGPLQLTPSDRYAVSPVDVSCGKKSCGIMGDSDSYIYLFRDNHDIVVSNCDPDIKGPSYSATLDFACSGTNNLSLKITRNGVTKTLCETDDNTTRKKWFPMQIHDNKSYEIKSAYYGWWFE